MFFENKPIKGLAYNDQNEPTMIEIDRKFQLAILLAPFIYNNTDKLLKFTYTTDKVEPDSNFSDTRNGNNYNYKIIIIEIL